MSTFFYCKNRLHFSLGLLLGACFSLLVFLYASLFSGLERVANRKVFYYLVQDSAHVEASVYNVSLNGGAGYVLEENGRFYAVYAVYFFRDKANEQALGLRERGEKVKILEYATNELYLKNRQEKVQVVNALSCLEMQMQDLEMEIARLQEGTTQEASKKRIMALVNRLHFCANAHKNTLGDYGEEIKSVINRLNEYLNGVIFAKDLRFELCVLSSVYLQVCENFSI